VTEQALAEAIQRAVIGNDTADIAHATQRFVEQHGYSVARDYSGHGVGRTMHEPPEVPNWWPKNARKRGWTSVPLVTGMTIAIEPMVITGRPDLKELADGWTVVAKDRSLCAHFEHTVAVTESGPVILTEL
jgi:methionyl aminopeptidase